jgi:protein TonB
MNQQRRFALRLDIAISVAMHACIVFPIAVWMLYTPRITHPRSNRLNIEVSGKIAKRQTVAQPKRIQSPVPKLAKPGHELHDEGLVALPKKPTSVQPHTPQVEPSTNAPEAVRLPEIASTRREDSNSSANGAKANAEQPQQAVVAEPSNMNDRIAAYMAQLTRLLQSNLIYPQDAKKKKIEGTSLVSFVITESGGIRANTLVVTRSSGSAALDASALRTVASSAPFQKPPRELNVSIELDFEIDSKIF